MQKGDFGAERREGAGAVRLGDGCQGRGRRWRCSLGRMVRGGGEGAGAVPLGWMCVVGKRSLWVE